MSQPTDWFCSRLVQDGDARIALDPLTGLNSYGCGCMPDPDLLEFGSATASTLSTAGFVAAREWATRMSPWIDRDFSQQRAHLLQLTQHVRERLLPCLVGTGEDSAAPEALPTLLLSASGTDALRQGAGLCAIPGSKLAIFLLEAEESGRGVPLALARCPDSCVHHLPARDAAGRLRPVAAMDQAVERAVSQARQAGERVLLVLTDVSKTGLIAPSPACVLQLQQRFGSSLQVLVDACQLRLAQHTVRAYLSRGFLVALTGSKFMGGPSFSGALLVPHQHPLLPSPLEAVLEQNILAPGPLVRWMAALADLEAFARIPEALTHGFLAHFAQQMVRFMAQHPRLEPLPGRELDRSALFTGGSPEPPSWDQVQTIFPFLLHRAPQGLGDSLLGPNALQRLFQDLPRRLDGFPGPITGAQRRAPAPIRGRLGQPVRCGQRAGQELSALRLCSSARLVLQGVGTEEPWPDAARVRHAADQCAQQAGQLLEYLLWCSAQG